MADFYFHERRLAYHLDGTGVFMRRTFRPAPVYNPDAGYWQSGGPEVVGTDYHEMSDEAAKYLNSANRYLLNAMPGREPGDDDGGSIYEILFMFPTPMDLSGIFFTMVWNGLLNIETSQDTTSFGDGTWTRVATRLRQSTMRLIDTSSNQYSGYPYAERNRLRDIRPTQGDSTEWVDQSFDQSTNYRQSNPDASTEYGEYMDPNPPGIHQLSGAGLTEVRAIRLIPVDDSSVEAYPSFGAQTNIHLYGRASGIGTSGVDIVREDGTPLSVNDFVFGNLPSYDYYGTPHLTDPFRVRNYSDTATAEDVTFHLEWVEDQSKSVTPGYENTDRFTFYKIRLGGGDWMPYDTVLDLGTLGPGDLSDTIEVRFMRDTDLSIYYLELGAFQTLFVPVVGGWS